MERCRCLSPGVGVWVSNGRHRLRIHQKNACCTSERNAAGCLAPRVRRAGGSSSRAAFGPAPRGFIERITKARLRCRFGQRTPAGVSRMRARARNHAALSVDAAARAHREDERRPVVSRRMSLFGTSVMCGPCDNVRARAGARACIVRVVSRVRRVTLTRSAVNAHEQAVHSKRATGRRGEGDGGTEARIWERWCLSHALNPARWASLRSAVPLHLEKRACRPVRRGAPRSDAR
jgi:hypothetical protein